MSHASTFRGVRSGSRGAGAMRRRPFVPRLEAAIPRYRERLLVLPGVTGLAQVHLGPDTDLPSVERKLAFDLYYLKYLGPWMDLRCYGWVR